MSTQFSANHYGATASGTALHTLSEAGQALCRPSLPIVRVWSRETVTGAYSVARVSYSRCERCRAAESVPAPKRVPARRASSGVVPATFPTTGEDHPSLGYALPIGPARPCEPITRPSFTLSPAPVVLCDNARLESMPLSHRRNVADVAVLLFGFTHYLCQSCADTLDASDGAPIGPESAENVRRAESSARLAAQRAEWLDYCAAANVPAVPLKPSDVSAPVPCDVCGWDYGHSSACGRSARS